jgi:hypothetical protein
MPGKNGVQGLQFRFEESWRLDFIDILIDSYYLTIYNAK